MHATATAQNQRWLKCIIEEGMFSDEVAVTYPRSASATDDWQKSVFVPTTCTRNRDTEGEVLVNVVTKGDKHYAVLPSSERDVVLVDISDLSS